MNKPKGGLGRGLAALIPTGPQTDVVANVFMGGSSKRTQAQDDEPVSGPGSAASTNAPSADRSEAESNIRSVKTNTTDDDDAYAAPATAPNGKHPALGNGSADGTGSTGPGSTPTDHESEAELDGDRPIEAANGPATETSIARGPLSAPLDAIGQRNGSRSDGPRYEEVPIDQIRRNPRNPRTVFDEDALTELEHSLREFGLLQPIVVRQVDDGYELVMGERRWRAAERAGLSTIPAIIRRTEDANLLRDALLENIHRANLNPLEEAAAYQQLLQEFGVTQDELATRIGRSRPVISNTIRLLKLPIPVQRRVAAGVLVSRSRTCAALTRAAWTTRRSWPPAWWPRACQCAGPRRPSF